MLFQVMQWNVETVAMLVTLLLGGTGGTYLTQFWKRFLNLRSDGLKATLNLFISLILGSGALLLTDTLDVTNFLTATTSIFTISTLFFNFIVKANTTDTIAPTNTNSTL